MKLKTTLLALVTVALICSAFAFVAVANADLELSASSATASAGDTVTITLNIDQNPGIYYLGLYLDYDKSALTLQSVTNNSSLTFMSGLQQIWYCNGMTNFTGTGALATITFTVNEDALDGEYEIGILTDWAECYDVDENTVNIALDKGVIKVCSHSETVSKAVKEPTCTENGENIIYCADCGVELSREAVPALGHTAGNWIVTVAPTCVDAGEKIKYCDVCGETVQVEVVPALGHVAGDWVTTKEPACTEEGAKAQYCTVCKVLLAADTIPAKGHGESCAVEVKSPTCTENGETWNVCMDCDAVLSIETIPALGHKPGDWVVVKAATCTATGLEEQACVVCDTVVASNVLSMIPHSYDDGVVTAEPSCVAEGVLTYSCVACDHSYTESIAKVPHSYDALGICTVCKAESALYISASDVRATYDDTFTIDLNLDRNAGSFYLSLMIDYDKDALELVSIENGSLFSLMTGNMYIWYSNAEDVTATGKLATLTFKVKETAEADVTYPISITVYECYNANEQTVDAVAGNGSVFVYDYVYGDANGDGKINGQDATRLLRYLANYNPFTGESTVTVGNGADANGDGKINGQDATRLLRYLANYNPFTGESSVTLGPSK